MSASTFRVLDDPLMADKDVLPAYRPVHVTKTYQRSDVRQEGRKMSRLVDDDDVGALRRDSPKTLFNWKHGATEVRAQRRDVSKMSWDLRDAPYDVRREGRDVPKTLFNWNNEDVRERQVPATRKICYTNRMVAQDFRKESANPIRPYNENERNLMYRCDIKLHNRDVRLPLKSDISLLKEERMSPANGDVLLKKRKSPDVSPEREVSSPLHTDVKLARQSDVRRRYRGDNRTPLKKRIVTPIQDDVKEEVKAPYQNETMSPYQKEKMSVCQSGGRSPYEVTSPEETDIGYPNKSPSPHNRLPSPYTNDVNGGCQELDPNFHCYIRYSDPDLHLQYHEMKSPYQNEVRASYEPLSPYQSETTVPHQAIRYTQENDISSPQHTEFKHRDIRSRRYDIRSQYEEDVNGSVLEYDTRSPQPSEVTYQGISSPAAYNIRPTQNEVPNTMMPFQETDMISRPSTPELTSTHKGEVTSLEASEINSLEETDVTESYQKTYATLSPVPHTYLITMPEYSQIGETQEDSIYLTQPNIMYTDLSSGEVIQMEVTKSTVSYPKSMLSRSDTTQTEEARGSVTHNESTHCDLAQTALSQCGLTPHEMARLNGSPSDLTRDEAIGTEARRSSPATTYGYQPTHDEVIRTEANHASPIRTYIYHTTRDEAIRTDSSRTSPIASHGYVLPGDEAIRMEVNRTSPIASHGYEIPHSEWNLHDSSYSPRPLVIDEMAQDADEMEAMDLTVTKVPAAEECTVVTKPEKYPLEKISTKRKRDRGPKSWEFLMRLLASETTNPSIIKWEDEASHTFRLVQPQAIAERWGARSGKTSLTYNNFARALRYHYSTQILKRVSERQLVYGCGQEALDFLKELNMAAAP